MEVIRKVLCWIFLVTSLLNLTVFLRCVVYGARYHYTPPLLLSLIVTASVSGAVALCSGFAWWTLWRKKAFAKGWAIAASASSLLIFIRPFVFPTQPAWDHHLGALFIGIVGLIAFTWPDKHGGTDESPDVHHASHGMQG